jgi:hypothetical protein
MLTLQKYLEKVQRNLLPFPMRGSRTLPLYATKGQSPGQARGLRYEAKPNGRLQNKVEAKPIFQYTVGHTFAYNF